MKESFTATGTRASSFDVASDGRFLRVQCTNIEPTASQMNIVVNWLEELKKLALRSSRSDRDTFQFSAVA